LDIYGHYLAGMQEQAAILMDELVTPIEAKWQQIGNTTVKTPLNKPNYTAYVAVTYCYTATFSGV
jgi:hypothetical protein